MRVFGPPGCGKSTYVSKQIELAVEKYGEDNIFVASFTKAGAVELAKRGLPVAKGSIGTLHSHCFAALGVPTIAETRIKEWNERHPLLAVSASRVDMEDMCEESGPPEDTHVGTMELGRIQRFRAKMIPSQLWPMTARRFWERWQAWKKEAGYLDFTDLIEVCLRDVGLAPGAPRAGFGDEAQDFTPLELALFRKWTSQMDVAVLVGDDDQTIYSFCGATPDAFLNPPLPAQFVKVLSQSHRVPRAVHALAQRVVSRISRRQPKEYLPRDEDGEVRGIDSRWQRPSELVKALEEHSHRGESSMVLAACSYMLAPLIAELRDRGVPFSNVYRAKRGDWNPMARGRKVKLALDRLMTFLAIDPEVLQNPADNWTWEQIQTWSEPLASGKAFRRGFKRALEDMPGSVKPEPWDLDVWMLPEAQKLAYAHDVAWYVESVLPSREKVFKFFETVVRTRGKKALVEKPLITIGTIHSVKGGESAHVYLFPDLSAAGYEQWTAGDMPERDSVIRQVYVGITRARKTLTIAQPSGRAHFMEALR
jgi:DNA helicase-2/ATP-dependent DNA helicase PcrA